MSAFDNSGTEISVIINCYNGEKFLRETLLSLQAQSFKNYEVVFWDNCSTDKTAEIAQNFDERLRYFYGEKHVSLGEARNYAIREARGKYIAFLDADDLWDSNKLKKQYDYMEEHPEIGMVTTNYKQFNMMAGATTVYNKQAKDRIYDFENFIEEYDFCLSTFMIRRAAIENLAYFFNNELEYAEEYELFIRIAYKWDVFYMKEPYSIYRIHRAMNSITLKERIHIEYDMVLDVMRNFIEGFDEKYPRIKKRLEYLRDFSKAKFLFSTGRVNGIAKLMKPYVFYNIRGLCFFLVALLPAPVALFVVNSFYKNRI